MPSDLDEPTRRGALVLAGSLFASGCTNSLQQAVGNSSTGGGHGPTKEYQGRLGITRAGWDESNNFEIEFSEDHNIDAVGIRYHAKEKVEDDIHLFIPPEYGGVKTVDLLKHFRLSDSTPPDGEYHIYAYKGQDMVMVFDVEEVMGHVSFTIAPTATIDSAVVTDSGELELTILNDGNSPTQLSKLEMGGRSVELETTITHGSSTDRHVETPPFERDGNCVMIPPRADFALETVPNLRKQFTVNTGREEPERNCTIHM